VWGTDSDAKRALNCGNLRRVIRTVGYGRLRPLSGFSP